MMNSLDLAILIIMSVAITVSAFRGGIREIFSFGSVIIGFILASRYYKTATDSFGFLRVTSHPEISYIITFIGIFLFTTVLISFIGGRISGIVKKSKLSMFDHVLGTAVGALKGLIICALVIYALMVFLPTESNILKGSKALPYIAKITDLISPIGPKFFRDEFGKKLEEFNKKDKEKLPEKPEEKTKPAPKPEKSPKKQPTRQNI
jgi:membrane protein required for colicin V production